MAITKKKPTPKKKSVPKKKAITKKKPTPKKKSVGKGKPKLKKVEKDFSFTMTDFSLISGITLSGVRSAINAGKLVLNIDKKIDLRDTSARLFLAIHPLDDSTPMVFSDPSDDQFKDSSKTAIEIEKIKQMTLKLQIHNDKEIKKLLPRVLVDKFFGELFSIILSHFHNLGERMAPSIAADCKITDPQVKIKIKKSIDSEMMRSLGRVKQLGEKINKT